MQVLKNVDSIKPVEFLNQPILTENDSTVKENLGLFSQPEGISKSQPFDSLLSLGKNTPLSKNLGGNPFFKGLPSNNKSFLNTESALFPASNPFTNERFFPDDLFKESDSKNTKSDPTNMNTNKALNFNDFMQLVKRKKNSLGVDCLRFLNQNSSKISSEGLNTGMLLPQLTSQGFPSANFSHFNDDLEKEDEEGDILKKKRKIG